MPSRAHPAGDVAAPAPDRPVGPWLYLVIAGLALRILISLASLGSNDAVGWRVFGDKINRLGLIATYRTDADFNHPPLPGYWAAIADRVAGESDSAFTNLFKLPAIVADGVGVMLLYHLWKRRVDKRRAMMIAAGFALSLDAILVSAYHCNTDSVLAALCLASVYMLDEFGSAGWSGVLLGAAINIKVIPLLLIPPLLLQLRRWRDGLRFTLGLGVCALPFVPIIWQIPAKFLQNVLMYNSFFDRWGINLLIMRDNPVLDAISPHGRTAIFFYHYARYLILAFVLAWAGVARWRGRWSACEVATVTFAGFLVLTAGFGVQYTVLPGLLLFACRPVWGFAYAVSAGVFLALFYACFWTGTMPALSWYNTPFPGWVAWPGLSAWIVLIGAAAVIISRPRQLDRSAI